MDHQDLLDKLNALLPAQFDELVFRLGVPPEVLAGTAQTSRAIEVIRYLQAQNRVPDLAALLVQSGLRPVVPAAVPRSESLAARPLRELVDELEGLLIQRARQVADDVKRGELTVAIDALVAEVKLRGRVKEGDVVAGTRLLKVVGTGNFGTIYLARRETDGVSLATKVFHLDKITEGMMLWSFRRSIKAMRHLNADKSAPASIVRIHEAAEDTLAFSMDYLSGGNLEDIASRGWTLQKKMDVFAEVCRSVAFAHAKGVIHRDIKPANVVLNEQQQPVLTDFDISDIKYLTKLSVARGSLGTPVFAAPEQLEDGNKATERSDIYSLGRVLYYLLLERSPGYQIEEDPQLANLAAYPATLVAIVRRATQHDPGKRYASVADLLRDIESHQSRAAAFRARMREAARWMRRNAALLVIFTLVVSGLGAFGIYQTRVARDKELQRKQQQELAEKNAALVEKLRNLQEVQEEAQRALNELTQRQGNLNQQRVALDQQIKLIDEEIKGSAVTAPKLVSLNRRRNDLQNELKSLNAKQAEFDRQIADQQLRLERAKADARSAATTLTPKPTATSAPQADASSVLQQQALKDKPIMAPPLSRVVIEFVSEKDGSVIPGVEFDYSDGNDFTESHDHKKHAVSGQTLLLAEGLWFLRVHYSLQNYQLYIRANEDQNKQIRIPDLGVIKVSKLPADINSRRVTINELAWDGKTIRIPHGKATIHIDSPYYKNRHQVTVSSDGVSGFDFPMKQYGLLNIRSDFGVLVEGITPNVELMWHNQSESEMSRHSFEEKIYRGIPGSYTLHTSQGDKDINIKLGQTVYMSLLSQTKEEVERLRSFQGHMIR